MIMAGITKKVCEGRVGWRIRFYLQGDRKEYYLAQAGTRGERMARTIAGHIQHLAMSRDRNIPPDPATLEWANNTEGKLREKLVFWGLIEPGNPKIFTDDGRFLEAFCTAYIESRTDLSPSSIMNFNQVKKCLVEFFGGRRLLSSITPAEADRWKRWLANERGLAQATVAKLVKRAKQLFKEGVRDRLLTSSPFADLKSGNECNPQRMRFIDRDACEKILDACPDADWRCIFGLARFCGLRCPSEILTLKWSDIDWDKGKIRIDAPKTGLRFCPLFPEIREILSETFELAPEGSVYVIRGYRAEQNLRTHFTRLVKRAGLEPWPKLFHNLRSSCRTELQERFPSHVCDSWLGHSTQIAERHYLQVTEDHWNTANQLKSEFRSPTGTPIDDNQGPSGASRGNKKTRKNAGFDGSGGALMGPQTPPPGLEPGTRGLTVRCSTD
jgi:integrase